MAGFGKAINKSRAALATRDVVNVQAQEQAKQQRIAAVDAKYQPGLRKLIANHAALDPSEKWKERTLLSHQIAKLNIEYGRERDTAAGTGESEKTQHAVTRLAQIEKNPIYLEAIKPPPEAKPVTPGWTPPDLSARVRNAEIMLRAADSRVEKKEAEFRRLDAVLESRRATRKDIRDRNAAKEELARAQQHRDGTQDTITRLRGELEGESIIEERPAERAERKRFKKVLPGPAFPERVTEGSGYWGSALPGGRDPSGFIRRIEEVESGVKRIPMAGTRFSPFAGHPDMPTLSTPLLKTKQAVGEMPDQPESVVLRRGPVGPDDPGQLETWRAEPSEAGYLNPIWKPTFGGKYGVTTWQPIGGGLEGELSRQLRPTRLIGGQRTLSGMQGGEHFGGVRPPDVSVPEVQARLIQGLEERHNILLGIPERKQQLVAESEGYQSKNRRAKEMMEKPNYHPQLSGLGTIDWEEQDIFRTNAKLAGLNEVADEIRAEMAQMQRHQQAMEELPERTASGLVRGPEGKFLFNPRTSGGLRALRKARARVEEAGQEEADIESRAIEAEKQRLRELGPWGELESPESGD